MKKMGMAAALIMAAGMVLPLYGAEPAVRNFSISCGDLVLKFDGRKFWNPNRIDFAGKNVAVESGGVHYGAVAKYKGANGFVGSGHKETGKEEIVQDYTITVDGQAVALSSLTEGGVLAADKEFVITKKSSLNQIGVDYTLKVSGNVMEESYTVRAEETAELHQLYLFMHPWLSFFEEFAIDQADPVQLLHNGKFPGNQPGKTVTFFSKALDVEICSTLLEAAPEGKGRHLIWDRKGDVKHYLMLWKNDTIQPGKDYSFKMRTEFRKFSAAPAAQSELPAAARFQISCGDLSMIFDKAKFFYANRMDYKGENISIDSRGVHYGAVISCKGENGFIGSGHKETGVAERVLEYVVTVDGKQVPGSSIANNAKLVAEKEFSIFKKSMLKTVLIEYLMTVADNTMTESYVVETSAPVSLKMAYLFMHPWTTVFESFAADGGAEIHTRQDGKFPFAKPAKTLSFRSKQKNIEVVSTLLEADASVPAQHLIWDRDRDTKHYLRVWHHKTMPAGKQFRFVMKTQVRDWK